MGEYEMAMIKVNTKNQLDINEKPRVYFTCHPEDFEKHFKKVCDDIFKTHDCAIYYTEDMNEIIAEDEKTVDLGRNNLFVVPVTYKLLSTPNRAMNDDIPYALKEHIPVLPVMMELDIDELYSKRDKFGDLQYLNPYSTNITEVSYEEKLKKYLESVLISDEKAVQVRTAFNTHVFLSYRKKDRKYANDLMRLIHSNPQCRDIAIWFDEFLTPGENFKKNIDRVLRDSKLFTLLVTPNLLEEFDGKPNFVMGEEYPAAYKLGTTILPIEMVETDKKALNEKFMDVPDCIKPDDASFHTQLLNLITGVSFKPHNLPAHNFLMGLAYLDGIDVEVNREFALEYITSAAEAGLPEAMEQLYRMYFDGIGVELDYRKAVVWAKKYAAYMIAEFGEEDVDTLVSISNLAHCYFKIEQYEESFEHFEKVYTLSKKVWGGEHYNTILPLSNLVMAYSGLGRNEKARELCVEAFFLSCKVLGKEHPTTLLLLNNLAHIYDELGDNGKALKCYENAYTLYCKVFGEEHSDTLVVLNNLANICNKMQNLKQSLEYTERLYNLRCKILGEEHFDTLVVLNDLAHICKNLNNYKKSLEFTERLYILRCKVFGEEHPSTLATLFNLAYIYEKENNEKKSLELYEKVYTLQCKVLGEEHPYTLTSLRELALKHGETSAYNDVFQFHEKVHICCQALGEKHPATLVTLSNLAYAYRKLGNYKKSLELYEKTYTLQCKVLGEEHSATLKVLSNLIYAYEKMGEYKKMLETHEKVYTLQCKVLGEEHPDTLWELENMAMSYGNVGNLKKELELHEKVYLLRCKVLGEEHVDTLKSLNNTAFCYKELGDMVTALALNEKVYAGRVKVLGKNHHLTIKTRDRIIEIKKLLAEE